MICGVGLKHHPDMSRRFRMAIKDKAAFQRSVETLATWEFDRIIVGHGEVLETDGKRLLEKAVEP